MRTWVLYSLFLVCTALQGERGHADEVSDLEYGRFVGLMQIRGPEGHNFRCSSVLVGRDLVLTAGHCLQHVEDWANCRDSVRFEFPEDRSRDLPVERMACARVIEAHHTSSSPARGSLQRMYPDIALIQLAGSVRSARGYAELSNAGGPLPAGASLLFSRINYNHEERRYEWSESRCEASRMPETEITWFRHFPFVGFGGCEALRGTSGAPLFYRGKLISIHGNSIRGSEIRISTSVACIAHETQAYPHPSTTCVVPSSAEVREANEYFFAEQNARMLQELIASVGEMSYAYFQWKKLYEIKGERNTLAWVPECVHPSAQQDAEVRLRLPLFRAQEYYLGPIYREFELDRTFEVQVRISNDTDAKLNYFERSQELHIPVCSTHS